MVRNPIQSLESWLLTSAEKKEYDRMIGQLTTFLYDFDHRIYRDHETRALRLEDLKANPEKTLRRLCEWMGINFYETILTPTAQGLFWGGDAGENITKPFEARSIASEIGRVFTHDDLKILATVLEPIYVALGYPFSFQTLSKVEFEQKSNSVISTLSRNKEASTAPISAQSVMMASILRLRYSELVEYPSETDVLSDII